MDYRFDHFATDDRSHCSPALAAVGDTICIAFTGTDEHHHLNFLTLWQSAIRAKVTSPQETLYVHQSGASRSDYSTGPGLASNGQIYVCAFTGTDSRINIMRSSDGLNFDTPIQLWGAYSDRGPKLTYGNGKFFLGWTNDDYTLLSSSTDGRVWTSPVQPNGDGRSWGIAWNIGFAKGQLYAVATTKSSDHMTTYTLDQNSFMVIDSYDTGEAAASSPCISAHGDNAVLYWPGTDGSHHINVMRSSTGAGFCDKVTVGDRSSDGINGIYYHPAPGLIAAWTGTDGDHSINVAFVSPEY